MERPTLNAGQAMRQAGDTVSTYLDAAVAFVDQRLGPGFARANPALVAACVQAQALDFNNTALVAALYSINDAITTASAKAALYSVGEAIRSTG